MINPLESFDPLKKYKKASEIKKALEELEKDPSKFDFKEEPVKKEKYAWKIEPSEGSSHENN